MSAMPGAEVALLDILDPAFRVDAPEVRAAADAGWWARTPIGIAVLRYQECLALLRDRRLRQGSVDALAAYGVSSGPFVDWLRTTLLSAEGQVHQRLRRLVSEAFIQRSVDRLRPFMRAKAHELIDRFADDGSCEFMTAFADPYPAWVIAELLGIPGERFDAFLGWATDVALGFSPSAAAQQHRIDAAVTGLGDCCDELIAQRHANPGEDLISALIAAEADGQRLTGDELRTMVSGLVFAGQDTTRNQLGLAMLTFIQHPEQWRPTSRCSWLPPTPSLAPSVTHHSTSPQRVPRTSASAPAFTTVSATGWLASKCVKRYRSSPPGLVTSHWRDPWPRDPRSASPVPSPCPWNSRAQMSGPVTLAQQLIPAVASVRPATPLRHSVRVSRSASRRMKRAGSLNSPPSASSAIP
jgi:hypothetical protein